MPTLGGLSASFKKFRPRDLMFAERGLLQGHVHALLLRDSRARAP
jgi:hypothetical protein